MFGRVIIRWGPARDLVLQRRDWRRSAELRELEPLRPARLSLPVAMTLRRSPSARTSFANLLWSLGIRELDLDDGDALFHDLVRAQHRIVGLRISHRAGGQGLSLGPQLGSGTGPLAADAALAAGDGARPAATDAELLDQPPINLDDPPAPIELDHGWILECEHHLGPGRELARGVTTIELVPSVGKREDTLILHWRDDRLASLPASLEVHSTSGPPHPPRSISGTPGRDGYTSYELSAEYLGELGATVFRPAYDKAYFNPTIYSIRGGPQTIGVEVYHPCRYKLEFKLPPMASIKAGAKYDQGSFRGSKASTSESGGTYSRSIEATGWTPRTATQVQGELEISASSSEVETTAKLGVGTSVHDTISLTRDGEVLGDLQWLSLVGATLKFAASLLRLVSEGIEYAPKVGWYIEWNLQLLQGASSFEWYWKEHTDHRAYEYFGFALSLSVVSLTFELGVGVSGLGFKVQVFAALSGEVKIEAGAERVGPGETGVKLPGIKSKITGALGARVEAGYFYKFEVKLESAIETELQVGINMRNSPVTFDARARWTGIDYVVTHSTGKAGIQGSGTNKTNLVPPTAWVGLEFPADEPYQPKAMSERAIAELLAKTLARGYWELLVYRDDKSARYSHAALGKFIARRVERDQAFDKSFEIVDALANAVHKDLLELADRNWWERDWLSESNFRAYCDASVKGKSLRRHIEAAASPVNAVIRASR